MRNLIMYTKSQCPQCVVAKSKLKLAGIQYAEVFVDRDYLSRQFLIDAGHKAVPVFYVDGLEIKLQDLLNKGI